MHFPVLIALVNVLWSFGLPLSHHEFHSPSSWRMLNFRSCSFCPFSNHHVHCPSRIPSRKVPSLYFCPFSYQNVHRLSSLSPRNQPSISICPEFSNQYCQCPLRRSFWNSPCMSSV